MPATGKHMEAIVSLPSGMAEQKQITATGSEASSAGENICICKPNKVT